MVTAPRHIKFLCAFLLLTTPAQAEEPAIPLNFSGTYDFNVAGIPFGQIDLNFTQSPTAYKAHTEVVTVGIAKVFVEHRSQADSTGSGTNYSYDHVTYTTDYSTNKKKKHVEWVKSNGAIQNEVVLPKEDEGKRPPVSEEQKLAAHDPIALGLAIRSGTIQARARGEESFVLTMFDGKRLWEATVTLIGTTNITYQKAPLSAYRVKVSRRQITGFTEKEISRQKKNEPPVSIYFTEDAAFKPVLLELPMMLGVATATLRGNAPAPADPATPAI